MQEKIHLAAFLLNLKFHVYSHRLTSDMQFGNSTLIEPLEEKHDPGFTVSTTI